ncbi:hypothetical protein C8K30_105253 [Promicromonospora sp. AC04]|uniref:hypothetical protein n=1 Tax=Promicromonospora sp. AC04 TaxID=2135723 RepID=UPI000D3389BC|nr:hypothetical protein [Promicromonospora sp. AC04]PUB27022.1 hypothetical protein C8K30_105253 [Promicromonospora sp. AC04]
MNESAGELHGTDPPDAAARLAALERENEELRRRLAAVPSGEPARSAADHPRRNRPRSAAAVVLILLGALLAPAGVVAAWAERTLTDTDRYVATVGPLADDPVVQSALAGRLTTAVMTQIDVGALLDDVAAGLEERDIAPRVAGALTRLEAPLTSGVESFVRNAANRVVESDEFESAWTQANRVAHEQLVAVMQGSGGDVVQVGQDGQLTIQLSGMIDLLKERLVDRGLTLAANLPTINATFTIMESSQLVQIQNRYAQLVALGTWLPWIVLILLGAGVVVAMHHLRALVVAGLALAAAMVVLAVGLAIARGLYLDALSGVVLRLDAAEVLFDQLVSFLRATLRTVGVLGLVVALAAYLGGSSASARSLRAGISGGLGRARRWAEGRGVSTGTAGTWLGGHRGFARTAVIALAALLLLLASSPTPALIVGVAAGAGVLIILIELLSRPASATQGESET